MIWPGHYAEVLRGRRIDAISTRTSPEQAKKTSYDHCFLWNTEKSRRSIEKKNS